MGAGSKGAAGRCYYLLPNLINMKLYKASITVIAFFYCSALFAQSGKPLHVGDRMPHLVLHPVLYHSDTLIDLSKQGSRLIILDLWATWCSSCVAGFPKSYQLEQQFPGQVQFILVSRKTADSIGEELRQTPEKIKAFLDKRKQDYSFPCVVSDTIIWNLFPPLSGIPYYVWLKNGKVIGLTGAREINAENIYKAIHAPDISTISLKAPGSYNFLQDATLAELLGKTGVGKEMTSSFCGEVEDYIGSASLAPLERYPGYLRFYSLNSFIRTLFYFAYPQMQHIKSSNCIIEKFATQEPSDLSPGEYWIRKDSLYSYELIVPERMKDSATAIMKEDLKRYAGAVPRFYKKKVKCLVLKLKDSTLLHVGDNRELARDYNLYEKGRTPKFMHGFPLRVFVSSMNDLFAKHFVDETHIPVGKIVNLDGLPADLSNTKALKKALKKYGIVAAGKKRKLLFAEITYNAHP